MKYLKTFEAKKITYKIGDQVLLLNATKFAKKHDFIAGNIYKIEGLQSGKPQQYCLFNGRFNGLKFLWFNGSDIRKATPEEISASKYNL